MKGNSIIRENPPNPPNPRSVFLALLLTLISFGSATAADSTYRWSNRLHLLGDDIALVWSDVGPYFTRPLHFDATDWRNASIVVGGTGVLMPLDSPGRRAAKTSSQSPFMQDFMNLASHNGDMYVIGLSVGITYVGGILVGSKSLHTTGREIIETLALAGATTTVLKYALGRSRPYANEGPYRYHPLSLTDNHHSLPSGHTTVAFAISSVLAARIQNPIATVLLYSASACTAFSRMYHDQHWLSDLFLGASIGTTTGLWVVHRDKVRSGEKPDDSGVLLTPTLGGLSMTYRF